MAGLLYKDFASIKWKLIVIIVVILTIALLGLRIGAAIATGMGASTDTLFLLQIFPVVELPCMFLVFAFYINSFPCKIIEDEKKNKINDYLGSLPISDDKYVLSKYLFVGISVYFAFSVETMWGVIIQSFIDSSTELMVAAKDLVLVMISIAYPLAIWCLFMAAIELPMIFVLGTARMQSVKNVFMEFLGVAVFAFLLFADREWFNEHLSIEAIYNWMETHQFELVVLQIFSICIVLGLFYLSYKLTCKMINKRKYKVLMQPSLETGSKEVA